MALDGDEQDSVAAPITAATAVAATAIAAAAVARIVGSRAAEHPARITATGVAAIVRPSPVPPVRDEHDERHHPCE
jgi:hypothetical protein